MAKFSVVGRCLPAATGVLQISRGVVKGVLLLAIRAYQKILSPLTPASCRFHPTCSEYAYQAILRKGVLKGMYLALRRFLRCHPFGGAGFDPPPD